MLLRARARPRALHQRYETKLIFSLTTNTRTTRSEKRWAPTRVESYFQGNPPPHRLIYHAEEANEKGGWIALKRFWKNEHYGKSKWSWDEHCKPKIDGYIYCNSHGCWGKDEHGRHDEDMYVGYDKDKNNEPNFSGCHARKSTLSGHGFDHQGTWADIKGDCKEFGCFCQPICH